MTVVLDERRGGMRIVGSGGGGKGGGGSSRTPVEYPDNLHNTSYAAILDLLGNGELAGPVHPEQPLRDVYLNNTPIQNEDGSLNFDQVQIEYRVGTVDQEYIAGFPAASSTVSVGAQIKTNQPFTQRLTNPDLSAVRVSIHAPRLMQMVESGGEAGDRKGTVVEYAIDLAVGGGTFKEVLRSKLDGKTINGYTRTHRIELPKSELGWTFRIRRLTPDSTNSAITDDIAISSYAEVVDGKFRYPMSALVGIKVNAEQFQAIPTRAYHWRGKVIRVPSNYNPETRTYSGVWNGTFKRAWSDNPAWVYYDVLTSRLSGLGDRVDASMIDRYALYQIGAYCDQLVPDGEGGTEPRFRVGLLYIQSQQDALRVLNDLTSVFRGMSYWANGEVVAVADMPSDPVYTYTNANVIDGVFEYTGSDLNTRKTVALVSWNDPSDFYRSKVEVVEDDDGIRRYGIRKTEVVAFGCTSRGQAQRVGLYHLYTSRMETGGVAFSVGLDGVIPQPGSIVKIADRNRAGRHIGGRIRQATAFAVTLDREHPIKVGDSLTVNLPNGEPETRVVSLVTGRVVRVRSAFSAVPAAESVWAVDSADLSTQYARVISVRENNALSYEISAVLHHPGKYSAIDTGARLDPLPISALVPRVQEPPRNVTLSSYFVIREGVSRHTLVIAWDRAKNAVRYEVRFRRNQANWITLPQTGADSIEVENIYAGLYEAQVRAINAFEVSSQWASAVATELDGLVGEPPRVTSLTTEGVPWGINLRWVFPSVPNIIERSEIRYGPSSDFNDATVLGEYAYPTNNFAHQGLKIDAEFFYWVRLVDKNGMPGAWYPAKNEPGISGVALSDAAGYNDLITQGIVGSALGQQLMSDIESIPDLQSGLGDALNEIGLINVNLGSVDDRFGSVDGQIAGLSGLVNTIDDEISSIESQIAELAGTAEWEPGRPYLEGQIVKFDGALYRAKQNTLADMPVSNAAYWQKIGDYDSMGEAVTALATRMGTAEINIDELTGEVSTNSSEIAQLSTTVGDLESGVSGNALAIDALETNVSEIDGQLAVTSTQTSILSSALREMDNDNGRLADVLNEYDSRVWIKENRETIVTNKLAQAQVNLDLYARIGDNTAQIGETKQIIANNEAAQALVNQSLASQVGDNRSSISTLQTTIVNDKQAQSVINQTLASRVDGNESEIATTKQTIADNKAAQASVNSQLQSSVNGVTSTVQDLSSTVSTIDGRVSATRTIKVSVNSDGTRYLAGIGVGVDNTIDGMQSQVVVVANRFGVMHSFNGTPKAVFSVQGGVTYMNSAMIQDASITNAKIADASINSAKIADASINSAKFTDWVQSDTYTGGQPTINMNFRTGYFRVPGLTVSEGNTTIDRLFVTNPNILAAGSYNVGETVFSGDARSWLIDTGVNVPSNWNEASTRQFSATATISSGQSLSGGRSGTTVTEIAIGDGLHTGGSGGYPSGRIYLQVNFTPRALTGTIKIGWVKWKLVSL